MCAKNRINIFGRFLDIRENVDGPVFIGPPGRDMLGSRVGFSGSADLMMQLSNFRNLRCRLTAILDIKNGHNFATGLPINVVFGSSVGFPAELRFLLWVRSCMRCCRRA